MPSDIRPLRILVASSEAVPFAKTGGLADVAGALPRELAKLGHDVVLVIPRYRGIDRAGYAFKPMFRFEMALPDGMRDVVIEEAVMQEPGSAGAVRVLAVRYDPFFDRPELYQQNGSDYPDNLERFSLFSRAVIQVASYLAEHDGWDTQVLHLNDWQTSLCAVYLKTTESRRKELQGIKTALTIHNLGYQGMFEGNQLLKTGLPPTLFSPAGLEFYGSTNLLKGGILFADLLTTVSPTYAQEITTQEFGFGLDGVIRQRAARLFGVTNGIDVAVWDPMRDPHIAARYSGRDLGGKYRCKQALQEELGLPVKDVPALGVVSRLTSQKGLDLLADIIPELMEWDLQLIVLGTGEPEYEARLRALQGRYRDRMGLRIGFDDALAHRIEAGADMFVMPSRYEPCGLSQLYSLRYGTIPIVRKTGGLADTVVPYSPKNVKAGRATGFHFEQPSSSALLNAICLALMVYRDRSTWETIMTAGMKTDVSWERSARQYSKLFESLFE